MLFRSYNLLIISSNILYTNKKENEVTVNDKKVVYDTIGTKVVQRDTIVPRTEILVTADWNETYVKQWRDKIMPICAAAKRDNKNVNVITHDGRLTIKAFQNFIGAKDVPFYQCDDLVLKTIIRSNPGVILMKGGTVIDMWHINQVPSYEVIKAKSMK